MFGRPPTGSLANRPSSRGPSSWGRTTGAPPTGLATRAGPTGNRPGTSMRGGFGFQVVDRPVTQQGLGGIRASNQGPGRSIQDRTYFQSELRQKINLLTNEIGRLNQEAEATMRENANLIAFEKRADALAEELRELQGQLGDLNTLVDKLHADADLEDFEKQYNQLKAQNQRESLALDEYFSTRQLKENILRELDRQIEEEKRRAEEKFNEWDPVKRDTYYELKKANAEYVTETQRKQAELDELQKKLNGLQQASDRSADSSWQGLGIELHSLYKAGGFDAKRWQEGVAAFSRLLIRLAHQRFQHPVPLQPQDLKQDPVKQKALVQQQKFNELKAKRKEIEESLSSIETNTGPQEKARLLEQANHHVVVVKEDNQETSGMERKLLELEELAKRLKEEASQLDVELDSQHGERNTKYEELLKRDKDMQAFIDSFESKRTEIADKNTTTEKNIVTLLERIKNLSKHETEPMPSVANMKELESDLKFKEKEMQKSESTVEALQLERERRLHELDKVEQLEAKVTAELKHLTSRMEDLKKQLGTVSNIQAIKEEFEQLKVKHSRDREILKYQRDSLRQHIQYLSTLHDAKKAQLQENETYTQLGTLEQKLRHHESNNFHLKEYISVKTAESDYRPVASEVVGLLDELNGQLNSLISMMPTR
ncbi:uncharacterized protein BJ171DRAFT_569171 [Polychytrium aggregatum]|uniref:uncharacterized protein n=1 Tax=Polychytrium aggregatum TaxID=110093 RepID=UPI0022FE0808|nr:uncharacterized protein BJ171DRAFT_569171 [Polychytrium aggregatum]KAI9203192.1 hypothetical protein BJ171DRAFT_569171 [Polychytrium aggregatum]